MTVYPTPDRSNFVPNTLRKDDWPEYDLGYNEGVFADGRPYRIEAWARDGSTFVTIFLSMLGLETFDQKQMARLFEQEQILIMNSAGLLYFSITPIQDASNQPIWSCTALIGDDEGNIYTLKELKAYL